MKLFGKVLLIVFAGAASVLGWGFWYSLNHAVVYFSVHDYGLKSARQRYGEAHDVFLVLRDAANEPLAEAHSIEPQGYILAIHPDRQIGDCRQYEGSRAGYASCFKQYSRWLSTWAPRVRSADVLMGGCGLRAVPVTVYHSNSEWPLWWVPLPHVGGLPRQYFSFSIDINGRTCEVVK